MDDLDGRWRRPIAHVDGGRIAAILVATILGLCVVWIGLIVWPKGPPVDAWTYLAAGERLNAGHPLYSLSAGDRVLLGEVMEQVDPVPLLSPPAIAIIWRPLAIIGEPAMYAWALGGALAVIATYTVLVARAWPTTILVLLALLPFVWLAAEGNLQGYLVPGYAALWLVRDRPRVTAVVAMTMVAIKLTPAPLVLWVARDRRTWPYLAATTIAWAGVVLVGAPGSALDYLGVARTGTGSIFWPILAAGLAGTILLPQRFAFGAAVVTSVVATSSWGLHWLVLLPVALVPWSRTDRRQVGGDPGQSRPVTADAEPAPDVAR